MPAKKVAVLVGSIRKDSINLKVARAVEKLAGDKLQFEFLRIDDLPLYTQEFDEKYPPNCQRLKDAIKAADAVLFVTPEYNRSIPGVLKNAIDIASRPYGTNAFAGKPGAIIGASPGAPGTSMAQQHLRNVALYLEIAVMGQPEMYIQAREGMFDGSGNLASDDSLKFLQGFVDKYVAWVNRLAAKA